MLHLIELVRGNMEANFARLMSFMAPNRHRFQSRKMLERIRMRMTHFQIDLPGKVGELVEVTESNMRMAVFLLLLKSRFKRNEFEVNETGVAEAQVYFDENIINDAMALHLTNHANLRRFLTKGARVKVMRLLPS